MSSYLRDDRWFLPGHPASYRFSLKIIGAIAAISLLVGVPLQLAGHEMYAGMTVALGVYLIICSVLFITIPLVLIDVFLD